MGTLKLGELFKIREALRSFSYRAAGVPCGFPLSLPLGWLS